MTVMRHTFHYPDGTPVVGAPVEIFLIAPGGRETTGYIGGVQVVSRWKGATDDNGRIGVNGDGVDLPVVDAPSPAVWKIECRAPGSHIIPDSYFTVPDEGPAEVNDNLVAAPNAATWSIVGVGPQGPGVVPRGEWASVNSYAVDDLVTHDGSAYVAVASNSNSEPPSVDWTLYVEKGDTGDPGVVQAIGEGDFTTVAGTADTPVVNVNAEALATDSAMIARYVAQGLQVLSLRDSAFNVQGDGVTDDSAEIQDAIAAAAAGGYTLLAPPGVYILESVLELMDHTHIIGAGASTVFKVVKSGGQQSFFRNDWDNGNTDIILKDFMLDRSGTGAEHGILLNGVDGLLIDGIMSRGEPSQGSGIIAVSGIGPTTRIPSKSVRVVNCDLRGCDNFGVQVGAVERCVVGHNTLDGFREIIGVEPDTGYTASDVSIVGNTVTTPGTGNGTQTGAVIATESSGGTIDGCTITGNTVRCTDLTPDAGNTTQGIVVLGASNAEVVGNVVRDMPGIGIQIGNATNAIDGCVVATNKVHNCNLGGNSSPSGAGIELRNASHTLVAGNHVKGTQHTHSIEESGGGSNNMLVSNILEDTTKYGTIGTGTIVVGNKTIDGGSQDFTVRSAGAPFIGVDGAASNAKGLRLLTSTVLRWILQSNSTAESGANAGSDLELLARTDAGAALLTAFTIRRSDGRHTFGGPAQLKPTTTAARPAAATAGAGALLFDVDLQKIIVSTGSAWEAVTSA